MSTTVVFDRPYAPKVTITRDDSLGLEAVIEIEGLAPQRSTTAEERAAGIRSLDPPTVRVRALKRRRDTLQRLVDGSVRAVQSSIVSTLEGTEAEDQAERERRGAGGIITSGWRIALGVCEALRKLDEDI